MIGSGSGVGGALAIGFVMVACEGCRSAHATRPSGAERAPSDTAANIAGLYFDPLGADFTGWVNHFKNEVYRNWVVPQTALMGLKGHVVLEFMIERNGTMTSLRTLQSSGTFELDRAAQNALRGSRSLPLPAGYLPPRITMRVTFFYNKTPSGSK
jgi:TonB family protein